MATASASASFFGLPDHAETIDGVTGPRSEPRKLHLVLATTGSVASVKAPLIVKELLEHDNVLVQVIATESSLHFYDADALQRSHPDVRVWRDADEWQVSDPILHIELRRWADLVLVAPCSANTLAKIANGLCDTLLTSLLRALDPARTPCILFPAMNTLMYTHPLTAPQLATAKDVIGYEVIGPISKTIACGDTGIGGMTEWKDIVQLVVDRYKLKRRPPT